MGDLARRRSHLQSESIEKEIGQIFEKIAHALVGLLIIDDLVLVRVVVDVVFNASGSKRTGKRFSTTCVL